MKKGFGYDEKHTFYNVMKHIVMELNNFLVTRFNIWQLFVLYYGRDIKIIFFILKKKWVRLWHGIYSRDKIINKFQLFIVNKLSHYIKLV